ncbi:MAG: T9SS type A sorting domain-containing protein [Flavobacteriales bacterium]|nr:T9SS type A sorting domain-containing protein [Flavobacteriales bacterium]
MAAGTLTRGHVDVSSLNTGVYVLSVRSGTAMSRQQFVKE